MKLGFLLGGYLGFFLFRNFSKKRTYVRFGATLFAKKNVCSFFATFVRERERMKRPGCFLGSCCFEKPQREAAPNLSPRNIFSIPRNIFSTRKSPENLTFSPLFAIL